MYVAVTFRHSCLPVFGNVFFDPKQLLLALYGVITESIIQSKHNTAHRQVKLIKQEYNKLAATYKAEYIGKI